MRASGRGAKVLIVCTCPCAGAGAHGGVNAGAHDAATAAHPAGAFDSSAGHFGRASAGIDAFQGAAGGGRGGGHQAPPVPPDAHGQPAGPHRWHPDVHNKAYYHEDPHGLSRGHWDPHRCGCSLM